MKPSEYASYDAIGLKALLDAGEVSVAELHDIAVRAIDDLDPTLNFMSKASPAEATRAISNLDREAPFAGVPILVKEDSGMAGLSQEFGSRLKEGLVYDVDNVFAHRLKRTGVVTLGSTNAPELGMSASTESLFYGPARNPWNSEHSTGGSSGGASAAVAAGVVPMAQSSDGGGSIRIPAHCCGVFGLMPSRGRNPLGPGAYGGPFGAARRHMTTRSVRDSAAMLDSLHGPEPGAWFRVSPPTRPYLAEVGADPGRLKIAFSVASPSGSPVDADCVAAVESVVRLCETLGHHVDQSAPDYDWETFIKAFGDRHCFAMNAIADMAELSGRSIGPDTLELATLRVWERSQSLTSHRIHTAFNELQAISCGVEEYFANIDVHISPVTLTSAPPLGLLDGTADDISNVDVWWDRIFSDFAPFTPVFNITGQPSMSVPLYQSESGLPIGIQCTSRIGDEATLIRLASQFESVLPWLDRRPPIGLSR